MRRIASMAQGYQICHCEERSDVAISQNPTGQQGSHRRNRNCLPEIATAPLGPRNDKLEGLAPQNACRKDCQLAWRSLSAATVKPGGVYGRRCLSHSGSAFPRLPRRPTASSQRQTFGFHHFNDGLLIAQVQRREGHVPPLQRAAEVLRILHSSFFSLPYSFASVSLPYILDFT